MNTTFWQTFNCPFCGKIIGANFERYSVVPIAVICEADEGGCDGIFAVSAEVTVTTRVHRIEGFGSSKTFKACLEPVENAPVPTTRLVLKADHKTPNCPHCGSAWVNETPDDADHDYRCLSCDRHFDADEGDAS